MKEIILILGIPGSGKSTRAKELAYSVLPGSVPILNRDSIRRDLTQIGDSRKKEDAVKAIQKTFLIEALKDPTVQTIIIDDAGNLKPETQALIRGWVAESGVEAKISFDDECLKTPVEVCVKRDAERANGVGTDAIRQWAQRYLPKPELPEAVKRLPPCVILDVDGCLAVKGDRGALEYEKALDDDLNLLLLMAISAIAQEGIPFIIVTGREYSEKNEEAIFLWIRKAFRIVGADAVIVDRKLERLFMRPVGDLRFALDFKKEAISRIMETNHPVLAIEDDPTVAQWMASQGIQVWQVHNANAYDAW